VNQSKAHEVMKIATVRDLRTRFPVVQGWLAEGESVAITKSGKRIATLTTAGPIPENCLRSTFTKRFGTPAKSPERVTHLAQTLIDDRGR
jgi:antitoxin (DNA-binding transcriptional repressor) of toxin-antitoxin stability system